MSELRVKKKMELEVVFFENNKCSNRCQFMGEEPVGGEPICMFYVNLLHSYDRCEDCIKDFGIPREEV